MNASGFPVQFPTTAPSMPQVRLAQPWAPAPRVQPPQRLRPRPASSAHMAPLGQTAAEMWARGSDISFSILTGIAAVVSGMAIIVNFGKPNGTAPTGVRPGIPVVPGRRPSGPKIHWYVIGGLVSVFGAVNIWASINRASAIPVQPTTTPS